MEIKWLLKNFKLLFIAVKAPLTTFLLLNEQTYGESTIMRKRSNVENIEQ